jgi:CRP-like cAMP-binding protein
MQIDVIPRMTTIDAGDAIRHRFAPVCQSVGETSPLTAADPRRNRLLADLPEAELARWRPHLELVDMRLGAVLYESGGPLTHAYFPTTSIVSLLSLTIDGASTEIAVVGNEGIVGFSLFMGGDTTPSRAVVQSAGQGFRLKASAMMQDLARSGPAFQLFLRYAQALITQLGQVAVCNRHHSLDQQLCRWLLSSLDRLASNELLVTQELIGSMLGVRREGVTMAAGHLQEAGVIRYRRGHITVLDRVGLEKRACECYAVVKREYDRLLPATRSPLPLSPPLYAHARPVGRHGTQAHETVRLRSSEQALVRALPGSA